MYCTATLPTKLESNFKWKIMLIHCDEIQLKINDEKIGHSKYLSSLKSKQGFTVLYLLVARLKWLHLQ